MAIRLKAEIPLVSDDRSLLQSQSSLIQQNADKILLRVTQTDLSTQLQSYASITLLNNQIATRVSTTDFNNTLTNYSTITQLNNSIATRVSTTDYNGNTIASLINQTATAIKIQAEKIDISGLVTISSLATAGQTAINGSNITTGTISAARINFDNAVGNNVNLTGTITANTGSIGRFAISGQDLVYTSELFDKDYDRSDVIKLHRILLGFEPQTPYDLAVYDVDNSGTLNITDLVLIDAFVQGIGSLPTPRKRIRSVVRIGTNNGALITQAVAENWAVGPSTTLRGEKITTDLISAKAISTNSFSSTSIVIGGSTYSLTRDSNGFLRAT